MTDELEPATPVDQVAPAAAPHVACPACGVGFYALSTTVDTCSFCGAAVDVAAQVARQREVRRTMAAPLPVLQAPCEWRLEFVWGKSEPEPPALAPLRDAFLSHEPTLLDGISCRVQWMDISVEWARTVVRFGLVPE